MPCLLMHLERLDILNILTATKYVICMPLDAAVVSPGIILIGLFVYYAQRFILKICLFIQEVFMGPSSEPALSKFRTVNCLLSGKGRIINTNNSTKLKKKQL
jgi:hypothetical protein